MIPMITQVGHTVFRGPARFRAGPQNSCFCHGIWWNFIKTIFFTENYLKVTLLQRCQTNPLIYLYFYLCIKL